MRRTFSKIFLAMAMVGAVALVVSIWPLLRDSSIRDEQMAAAEAIRQKMESSNQPATDSTATVSVPEGAAFELHIAEAETDSTSQLELVMGEAFGVISAPRLGDNYAIPILQGIGEQDELTKGVGHYPSTQGPCEVGNFALAGHRTTHGAPFMDIDKFKPGDLIEIETSAETCVYEVYDTVIVKPDQNEVLSPVPMKPKEEPAEAVLTLTACHPKYSIAERIIVFAKMVVDD